MYRIVGADGKLYGPATVEQLKQWISEGRANAQTQTLAEGATEWKPLGALPEFAGLFAPPVPPVIGPPRPGPPAAGQRPRTNPFAMAGMIFGILAFACCPKVLFGVLGLIFSLIGLSQINRHPESYEGRGLAIAGLVLSIAGLLLFVGLLILALATGHFYCHWGIRHF
jgi:hypothetical protein